MTTVYVLTTSPDYDTYDNVLGVYTSMEKLVQNDFVKRMSLNKTDPTHPHGLYRRFCGCNLNQQKTENFPNTLCTCNTFCISKYEEGVKVSILNLE